MQVTKLLLILLEIAICGISALPVTTDSSGSTLGRCVDCEGSSPAGPWGRDQGHIPQEEQGLHVVQADRLNTLLGHIETTQHICEGRTVDETTPGPRFLNYDLPPRHSLCPHNMLVTLTTYTEELTSTLASYTTLLQLMAHTEAIYQSEVTDTDPAFSQLANLTQTVACGLRLSVGVGRLCDRRAVPTETSLQLHERFWWDIKIVSDLKVFVRSAKQCLVHWQTRGLWQKRQLWLTMS